MFPWRKISVVTLVTALLITAASPALAASFQSGQAVNIDSRTQGDLFAAGESVSLQGAVGGDGFTAGNRIRIEAPVEGSLHAAGRLVEIDAPVEGSVRALGQNISVADTVARDLMAAGETVVLDGDGAVDGEIYATGTTVALEGDVGGDVFAGGTTVEVDGRIDGDATLRGEQVILGSDAVVTGDLRYTSDNSLNLAEGAAVQGDTIAVAPRISGSDDPAPSEEEGLLSGLWGMVRSWATALVTAAVLFLVWKALPRRIAEGTRRWWLPPVAGLVALVAVPVAAVLTMITVVGLPVGGMALGVYLVALYLAQIFVGSWLGQEILEPLWTEGSGFWYQAAAVAIGLVLVRALSALPYVGGVLSFVTFVAGFGLLTVVLWGTAFGGTAPAASEAS